MSIQLLRVEAEYFHPGEEITGPGNIILYTQNIPVGAGTGLWVAKSPNMRDSVFITPNKITFVDESCFLRLKAIGLESDTIHSGDLDFQLYIEPAQKVLGKVLWQLVSIGESTVQMKEKDRRVTFVAVLEVQDGQCMLVGILPLDYSLTSVVLKTDNEMTKPQFEKEYLGTFPPDTH